MSPESHPPRGPHGWPMPPMSVGRRHIPATQTLSPSQFIPPGVTPSAPQHGPSVRPQRPSTSGVTQSPLRASHESPLEQGELPSQQRPLLSPQPSHIPVVALHTSPERHVKPAQQMPPEPPHPSMPGGRSPPSGLRQTPAEHTRPVQQSADPEHVDERVAQH